MLIITLFHISYFTCDHSALTFIEIKRFAIFQRARSASTQLKARRVLDMIEEETEAQMRRGPKGRTRRSFGWPPLTPSGVRNTTLPCQALIDLSERRKHLAHRKRA